LGVTVFLAIPPPVGAVMLFNKMVWKLARVPHYFVKA
jgi:hypothetical protein